MKSDPCRGVHKWEHRKIPTSIPNCANVPISRARANFLNISVTFETRAFRSVGHTARIPDKRSIAPNEMHLVSLECPVCIIIRALISYRLESTRHLLARR